jgi:transcriptional regulator with XRE-family HTH domain
MATHTDEYYLSPIKEIAKIVDEECTKQGLKKYELLRRLKMSNSGFNNTFRGGSLQVKLLFRICEEMGLDLFALLSLAFKRTNTKIKAAGLTPEDDNQELHKDLISLYKFKVEQLEKEVESLNRQIKNQ